MHSKISNKLMEVIPVKHYVFSRLYIYQYPINKEVRVRPAYKFASNAKSRIEEAESFCTKRFWLDQGYQPAQISHVFGICNTEIFVYESGTKDNIKLRKSNYAL